MEMDNGAVDARVDNIRHRMVPESWPTSVAFDKDPGAMKEGWDVFTSLPLP